VHRLLWRAMRRAIVRKARGDYHHGNLRRALIAGAVLMLADVGPDEISLRELTRRIGVDHRAAYRHFRDRQALLTEVAEDGFRALIAQIDVALGAAPVRAVERLLAIARAYIQFAIHERGRYRAMIYPRVEEAFRRAPDGGDAALTVLVREVAAGIARHELADDDAREVALGLWSGMHGLASLIATRRLYVRRDLMLDYASRIFERSVRGITARRRDGARSDR
jgi:AcrR family transcriptional regulator